MGCIPKNTTVDRATRATLEKEYYGNLSEKSTQADIMAVFDKIDKAYPASSRIVEIRAEDLPKKVWKQLGLKEGDIVQRYAGLSGRATDPSKELFIKSKGVEEARRISAIEDNILKRETGTLVHGVLEELVQLRISEKVSKDKNSVFLPNEGRDIKTYDQISRESGMSVQHMKNLSDYVNELLDKIQAQQKKIDLNGKVKVYTERFIPDFSGDLGATVDLMALYSDTTSSVFDFKTIYPNLLRSKTVWNSTIKAFKLDDESWIPAYKIKDITTQMRGNKTLLESKGLTKKVVHNRAIPIHVQLELKPRLQRAEGKRFTSGIYSLSIGEKQDPALSMIPIDELTGIKKIDDKIIFLRDLIHNYEIKLDKSKSTAERRKFVMRLKGLRRAVDRLIIDRDSRYLVDEAGALLRRYYDRLNVLKNIDDAVIDGKPNPAYLSTTELTDIIHEFEGYRAVLDSSGELIATLKVKDEKAVRDYLHKVQILSHSIGDALTMMKQIRSERSMTTPEIDAIKDQTKLTWWQRLARTMTQQLHPVIRNFSKRIQESYNKSRLTTHETHQEILSYDKKFDEYSKQTGLTRKQIYDLLIDKNNLHNKYTSEIYKLIKDSQTKEDRTTLGTLLRLREDASEKHNEFRQNYILNNDPTPQELARWELQNKIENAILDSKQWYKYYEIKDNPTYYTEGYKNLTKPENKVLLEFWNFWQETMAENRKKAGFAEYEQIPNNFLPWIRADVVDMIAQGTLDLAGVKEYMDSILRVKSDEQIGGMSSIRELIDPATGELKREVPLWYIQPLFNAAGEVDPSMKSRNLLQSLLVFTDTVNKYYYLKNEVEPHVEALKDIMAEEGQKIQSDDGRDKTSASGILARLRGKEVDSVSLFNQLVDYHLYGVKIQDVTTKQAKFFSNLKSFQMKKELAFAILAPMGNFVQVRSGAYFEGLKGYFYKPGMLSTVERMAMGVLGKDKQEIYNALRYFLEPNSDKSNIHSKNLAINKMQKWVNWDTAFIGYRLGDHNLTDNVAVAMMMNYGLDADGNIKRLANLPKGTKSLFEGTTIKDGNLHIEGFMDSDGKVDIEKYTIWRNMVVGVAREIKGGLNSEDIQAVNLSMLGNLFMGFKNWMPGMIDNRASAIRYDHALNAVVEGKYRAFLTDMGIWNKTDEDTNNFVGLIVNGLLPSLGKFMLDLSTFGWLFNHKLAYKVNESRAQLLFQNYKDQFKNDPEIQKMTFEDFLEYKQGQMRSLAAEIAAILSLVSLVAWMGGASDDGDKRYKATWTGRTLFRLANRARREIAFFISPDDWRNTIARAPIPAMGLLYDVQRWAVNFRDEAGDIAYGDEVIREGLPAFFFGTNKGWRRDKPAFYETVRFIPGNKAFKTFEIYDLDKEAAY